MCFTTFTKDHFKVADQDIVCYKLMVQPFPPSKYYLTPFIGTRVEVGDTINGDFADFTLEEANSLLEKNGPKTKIPINLPILQLDKEVVHAFETINSAALYRKVHLHNIMTIITEWVIPAGTPYMTNNSKEIVATKMKFKNVIKE